MYEQYGQEVDFLTVYIVEAHAVDEWPVGERVEIRQPISIDERCRVAEEFRRVQNHKAHIVVDSMDNCFHNTFSAWPVRFYIIKDGVMAFVAHPTPCYEYEISHVFDWLSTYVFVN